MKKTLYFTMLILFFLQSCYKDKGNYTYLDAEVITVEGIPATLNKVSAVDKITIDPLVISTDQDAEFECFWGIYEKNVQGSVPVLDTIARTKSIDYLVVQDAKSWALVFGAKNINTGLTKLVTATLNVTTDFTRGWYVLKDDGNFSDIDQFLTPDSIQPTRIVENVFSAVNGRKLEGKAKQLAFFSAYKTFVANPSTASNTRTLFALSEKDVSAIYIDNFKQIRQFNEIFFEVPLVKDLNVISVGRSTSSNYLINNGKLHFIYNMSINAGIFGAEVLNSTANVEYQLSPYMVGTVTQLLFYDKLSSSFFSHATAGSYLLNAKANTNSEMPAQNINKDLLYMSERYPNPAVAVFRDRTDSRLMLLSQISGSYSSLNINNDTIASGDKMQDAGIITSNKDEAMLYFAVGNEIWSRNIANQHEQIQYAFPAGEEITFIRHLKYTTASDPDFNFNYIVVATTSAGRYKIHCFTKSSGNLSSQPEFTMEGVGRVGAVTYVSPFIGDYTYSNAF
jgi:hypothetical protein